MVNGMENKSNKKLMVCLSVHGTADSVTYYGTLV